MTGITPTLGIKETAANIGNFFRENKETLWSILKPLLPWIIGLYALDILVTVMFMADSEHEFGLGGFIAGYFFTCLIISWHRVVIYGAQNAVPMNPFKPQKHEWVFLGMGLLLGLCAALAGFIFGLIFFPISPALGALMVFLLMPVAVYIGFRFTFYFPAKAVNNSITLKESFRLTKGYVFKLLSASFIASLKYIVGLVVYFVVIFLMLGLFSTILGDLGNNAVMQGIFGFFFSLPVLIYFYPILIVVGVTAISNYYLYALQHKS